VACVCVCVRVRVCVCVCVRGGGRCCWTAQIKRPGTAEARARRERSEGRYNPPAAPDSTSPTAGARMTFMHTSSCPTSTCTNDASGRARRTRTNKQGLRGRDRRMRLAVRTAAFYWHGRRLVYSNALNLTFVKFIGAAAPPLGGTCAAYTPKKSADATHRERKNERGSSMHQQVSEPWSYL
jgi:hypothetical protein